jgi:Fe-S-cluster containining protein
MTSGLPCSTCHADCCGPVPLSASRFAVIERHLSTLSDSEYAALKSQKRSLTTCAFVDMRTYRCAVYPVRPSLCDVFGRTELLKCPHHPKLVNIISASAAELRVVLETNRGIVALSNEYAYDKRG